MTHAWPQMKDGYYLHAGFFNSLLLSIAISALTGCGDSILELSPQPLENAPGADGHSGQVITLTLPTPTLKIGSILAGQITLGTRATKALTIELRSSYSSSVQLIQPVVVVPAGLSTTGF